MVVKHLIEAAGIDVPVLKDCSLKVLKEFITQKEELLISSAVGMKAKKAEKWAMPAASVSRNSTRRIVL